jgi:hypothetical protein
MPINLGGNELSSLGVKLLNDTSLLKSDLLALWDPGLISSYPGSGTSWSNWVANNRNWTLTNGPTFSTAGGGSFVFDGSNDYAAYDQGVGSAWTLNTPFTVNFWIRTSSTSDMGLMSHYSGGPVNSGMFVSSGKLAYAYYNGDWRYNYSTGSFVNTNNWVMVTYAAPASSSGTIVTYVNGIADWSFTVTGGHFQSNIGSIGILWGFSPFNGSISQVSTYSIQHSASQVLQNYNSTRQRYGV